MRRNFEQFLCTANETTDTRFQYFTAAAHLLLAIIEEKPAESEQWERLMDATENDLVFLYLQITCRLNPLSTAHSLGAAIETTCDWRSQWQCFTRTC